MPWFVFITLFFTPNLHANDVCRNTAYRKAIYAHTIAEYRKERVVPTVDPIDDSLPDQDTKATPIDPKVVDEFKKIQKYIYGNDTTIMLKKCNHCDAEAILKDKSIYIENKFIDQLKKDYPKSWLSIVRYTLAHEFSHIIHEHVTRKNPNKISPLGYYPRLSKCDQLDVKEIQKEPGNTEYTAQVRIIVRSANNHSEIDGLGLTILEQMGYSDAPAAYHYTKDSLFPKRDLLNIETELRRDLIQSDFVDPTSAASKVCEGKTEDEIVREWNKANSEAKPVPQAK